MPLPLIPPFPVNPPPRRIAVLAEGQLGDLLMLTPALRAIKQTYPAACTTVLVLQRRSYEQRADAGNDAGVVGTPAGGTSVVLLNDPHVDQVAEIDRQALRTLSGPARIRAEWSIIRWLRSGRFDVVICTFPQDRFFQWAFLSGARVRVGELSGGMSLLLNRRVGVRKRDGGVLRYYCSLAAAAGATVTSWTTRFEIPQEARAWADRELPGGEGRIVAIHPGASGMYRVWPPESYAAVADYIQNQKGYRVILCGTAFDTEVVEAVRRHGGSDIRVIMTDRGISGLGALLQRCVLCISNNSGPRHLAVAVGTPSLAVIPRFDDVEWKIYDDEKRCGTIQSGDSCPACGADTCRNIVPPGEYFGSTCMRAVTVGQVIARLDSLL